MALRLFRRVVDVNVGRMEAFQAVCPADVPVTIPEGADARALSLPDASADLAVTSPPYINAVDYPRTHQLEMYLLDLPPPGTVLAEAKRQHIGTEVVRAADYRQLRRYGLPALDELVSELYSLDRRRAYIVHRYFVDMERNFREVHRVVRPGGRYVVVVGNNLIRGRGAHLRLPDGGRPAYRLGGGDLLRLGSDPALHQGPPQGAHQHGLGARPARALTPVAGTACGAAHPLRGVKGWLSAAGIVPRGWARW